MNWREANEQGKHLSYGKEYDQPEKLELSPPEKGKSMNILKRKHRLKSLRRESKTFARVGWILDYGLRLREEKGWEGGKRRQLRAEKQFRWDWTEDWTQWWRGSSRLDEKCTGWKELRTNDRKTNCVILKKIWKGRGVIQNTYVKISSPERRRGRGVKRIPNSPIYIIPKWLKTFFLDSTTPTIRSSRGLLSRGKLWYQLVTPTMRLYIPRVGARLRGITA